MQIYKHHYCKQIYKQNSKIKSFRYPAAFMRIQEATKEGERHICKPASKS
jgi:hypothetical protein